MHSEFIMGWPAAWLWLLWLCLYGRTTCHLLWSLKSSQEHVPKSSPIDFIPTPLIVSCSDVFSHLIAHLANLSFAEGCFPSCFKSALVTPLLKKPDLDTSNLSNFRPISNLNNISKILERLFLMRIKKHITSCPNFSPYQSAYREGYSTETALVSTLDNIFSSIDNGKACLSVCLDLSAAFDTVDHKLLLSRLTKSFGVSGTALNWLSSYLSDRNQQVGIGTARSDPTFCTDGVPQGSVLGPLLFTIFISPISRIANHFGVKLQQYADDTQLHIALSHTDQSGKLKLEECLSSIYAWFCFNGLAINPDKSEAILFGSRQRLRSFPSLSSIDLAGSAVPLSASVKTLGVTLDSKLTFRPHITNLCKSCFYHIRAIRHIRSALTKNMSQTLACSLVSSRLDYANSVFVGLSDLELTRLQRIQNSLARVVLRVPLRTSSSVLLHQLHWLPVAFRIKFKLACLTYKALSTSTPPYLQSLLTPYTPPRCLRSSSTGLLAEPRCRTVMGSRAFHASAPKEWNRLPLSLRISNSLPSFKKRLKTHYFSLAFKDLDI